MGFQKIVISVVESLFPTGTKRRKTINIVGRPMAIALGFPVPRQEDIICSLGNFDKIIKKSIKINDLSSTVYWDSIANFLQMKTALFLNNPENRLLFPLVSQPIVSILLVTFNKVEYTFQCLESLKANTDVPYEVIIVDNASTDRTPELLDRLENVTVIKNEDNLGFVKACNQGAKSARGKYVTFLNNDTQVCPGWLHSLVRTMEEYPKCGAVGGKLITPEGRLQEAGSILLSDGAVLGYGRDNNPASPEYNFVREVDFCSGACLLVSKCLFTELGGFDERYAPAYYEEADLCFSIRQSGFKVVYQPETVIIHYEFGSGSHRKASELSKVNKKKFVDKWDECLAKDNMNMSDVKVVFARDRRAGQRVLVVDDRIPAPYLGSGYPRAYAMLCDLASLGYIVTFVPLSAPDCIQPHTRYLQQMGIEVFYSDTDLEFKKFIAARKGYYETAIVSRPHNMSKVIDILRRYSPSTTVIYDAEALFALRDILKHEVEGKRFSENEQKRLIAKEVELLKKADILVAVSEYEKKVFNDFGCAKVEVWGHPLSLKTTDTNFKDRKDILFVGSFLLPDSPNEDAAIYFVEKIFPAIKAKLNCRLWIVGTNRLESIKALESEHIVVTGRVVDLMEYFDRCRLFVVPHRFSAGISLKLLESMSNGLPAVVSPLIAKQLGLTDGEEVLVASSPDKFVDNVERLYTDEKIWKKLRATSSNFVQKTCNEEGMKKNLDKIVKQTFNKQGQGVG